jgi:hypothetical protein
VEGGGWRVEVGGWRLEIKARAWRTAKLSGLTGFVVIRRRWVVERGAHLRLVVQVQEVEQRCAKTMSSSTTPLKP